MKEFVDTPSENLPRGNEALKQGQNTTIPDWLNKLQNESWQAEILISGGAFVGLLNVHEVLNPVFQYFFYSTNFSESILKGISNGVDLIVFTLTIGFLVHLVLRGYWVGFVGMNYVFPKGIDQDRLAMKGRFKNMFRRPQNTSFIVEFDKLCSAFFAITFLCLFSSGFAVIYISIFIFAAVELDYTWLTAFVILISIITLADFFTAGRLKKIKWFAIVYYPFHKVMSYLTLSFVYRRLYYTIVSNIRWGYAAMIFSIPILFIVSLTKLGTISSGLDDSYFDVRGGYYNPSNLAFVNINEEIIHDNFLDVTVLHIVRLESEAFAEWKKKNPSAQQQAFNELDKKVQQDIIGELYQLKIDGDKLPAPTKWLIHEPRNPSIFFSKMKLVSVLDISSLREGSHQLSVRLNLNSEVIQNQEQFEGSYAKVSFYCHKPDPK